MIRDYTTPEALRELADNVLAKTKEVLARDKTFTPYCVMVHRDDSSTVIGIDDRIMNNEAAKAAMFGALRQQVISEHVVAVAFVVDVFFADLPIHMRHLLRTMTVEEMDAFGLCKKQEAIGITVQTPLFTLMLRQPYERVGENGIVFGGLKVNDSLDPSFRGFGGRMNMFPEQAKRA